MTRRVYTETANSYAPFRQAQLQGLGSAPSRQKFDKNGWPDVTDKAWHSAVYGHYGYKPYWEEEPGLPSQV